MENGDDFAIKEQMTCETKNVIYLIKCCGCEKTYIGETGMCLKQRMSTHKTHINHAEHRKLAVSHHIFHCARDLEVKFKCMPIYKMPLNCSNE